MIIANKNRASKMSIRSYRLKNSIKNVHYTAYPNPNDGKFIVQHSSILLKSYVIYNMVGVNVLSHKSNLTNQFKIDLSTQPKGIYFVEITDINNNYLNKKIIIE